MLYGLALIICLNFIGLHAHAQLLESPDPEFLCIYKVNDKCPDTVKVIQRTNNIGFQWVSKTNCPVKLGFGETFYRRGYLLIEHDNRLEMMFSAMHKDEMLRLDSQEPQQITNGYGAYRVLVRSKELLFGRLLVYNIRFKPESAPGSSVDLRYSPAIGIISLHNLDRQNETVGKVELVKVNGVTLEQFVKALPEE